MPTASCVQDVTATLDSLLPRTNVSTKRTSKKLTEKRGSYCLLFHAVREGRPAHRAHYQSLFHRWNNVCMYLHAISLGGDSMTYQGWRFATWRALVGSGNVCSWTVNEHITESIRLCGDMAAIALAVGGMRVWPVTAVLRQGGEQKMAAIRQCESYRFW